MLLTGGALAIAIGVAQVWRHTGVPQLAPSIAAPVIVAPSAHVDAPPVPSPELTPAPPPVEEAPGAPKPKPIPTATAHDRRPPPAPHPQRVVRTHAPHAPRVDLDAPLPPR